jgi:hypothetical protein
MEEDGNLKGHCCAGYFGVVTEVVGVVTPSQSI